jgi:gamma-glutamylcyclotransferase (GGCT)/AIG2-like uncharacterized protein YtfP
MEPNNDENQKPSTKVDQIAGDQNLSSMSRKFLSGRAFEPPQVFDNFTGFSPQYFFLYGSLMDPRQLRKVLHLEETPVLQSASIIGWVIMMWGQYPALVLKVNNVTCGMAYEVQKEAHIEYLMHYEMEVYKVKGCMIKLADRREVRERLSFGMQERSY